MKVVGLQLDMVWEDPAANRSHIEGLLGRIAGPVDVMVLPEMFTTGFTMAPESLAEPHPGPTLEWMTQQARRLDAALVGSVVVREQDRFYNRLYWVLPDGTHHAYNKRHLFTMAGEHHHYTAGTERLVVEWRGWRWLPVICYDLRFPVWLRNRPPYYDAMVVVANWPQPRSQHWALLLQARAVENQVYVVGVNRVGTDGHGIFHDGRSAVIDPTGEVIIAARQQENILTANLSRHVLERTRRHMPFLKDADAFRMEAEG